MKLPMLHSNEPGWLTIWTTVALLASTLGWTDAAAQTDSKAIVAVFDIHNQGTPLSPSVVKRLGDYLAGRLAMCRQFAVAPRDQLKERLAGQRTESRKDCYDQSCQIEFGKLLSADKSLATSLIKLGRVCEVTSSLYDVRTETTDVAAAQEGLCTEDGIRQSLKTVISMLCQGIGGNVQQYPAPAAKEAMLPPPPVLGSGAVPSGAGQELPPVRKEVGYLSVQGEPKGARVDISGPAGFGQGGELSTSLPMRPIEVPAGDYVVKVSQSEYEVESAKVHVSADETKPVQINLIKSFGRLILSGNPEGARTSLRCAKKFEKEFGLPGQPLEIWVPRGDCRIFVSRDGYESFQKSYRLEGGQDLPVVVKLAKRAVVVQMADPTAPQIDQGASDSSNAVHGGKFTLEQAELMLGEAVREKMEQNSSRRLLQIEKIKTLLANPDYRKDPSRAPRVLHMLAEAYWDESFYRYMKACDQWNKAYEQYEQGILKELPPEPTQDYSQSLEYYRQLLRDFPDYVRFDEIIFFIGKGALKEGKVKKNIALQKEGVNYLDRLVKTYPQSERLSEAHLAMAEYFFERNQLYYAKANYEIILGRYPKSSIHNYAQYKLSWVYFSLAEFEKAIQGFQNVVKAVDKNESRAATRFRDQALNDLVVCFAEVENGRTRALDYFRSVLPESEVNAKMRVLSELQAE